MSDPERLLGGDASDFERELLRSWETEQPTEASRAAVLAAVGAGAGVATMTAAKVGGAVIGGSIAPKAAASAGAVGLLKWGAVVVTLGALGGAAGYLRYTRHVPAADAPRAASVATAEAPVPPVAALPPAGGGAASLVTTPDSPPAADPVRTRSLEPRAKPTPRAHPSALGEQVSALDAARRSMTAGDAAGALRQVDEYEARFRDGALTEEAEVLRIQALLAEGDRASATRVGERFLEAHPGSPHAARVRALLASP